MKGGQQLSYARQRKGVEGGPREKGRVLDEEGILAVVRLKKVRDTVKRLIGCSAVRVLLLPKQKKRTSEFKEKKNKTEKRWKQEVATRGEEATLKAG